MLGIYDTLLHEYMDCYSDTTTVLCIVVHIRLLEGRLALHKALQHSTASRQTRIAEQNPVSHHHHDPVDPMKISPRRIVLYPFHPICDAILTRKQGQKANGR